MQNYLVADRSDNVCTIRSANAGTIDTGFIRAVLGSLSRLYRLYEFQTVRGRKALDEVPEPIATVKIDAKRQGAEQYVLFYPAGALITARSFSALTEAQKREVAESLGVPHANAALFAAFRPEPFAVCAVNDIKSFAGDLEKIRCKNVRELFNTLCSLSAAVMSYDGETADLYMKAGELDQALSSAEKYFKKPEEPRRAKLQNPARQAMEKQKVDLPAPSMVASPLPASRQKRRPRLEELLITTDEEAARADASRRKIAHSVTQAGLFSPEMRLPEITETATPDALVYAAEYEKKLAEERAETERAENERQLAEEAEKAEAERIEREHARQEEEEREAAKPKARQHSPFWGVEPEIPPIPRPRQSELKIEYAGDAAVDTEESLPVATAEAAIPQSASSVPEEKTEYADDEFTDEYTFPSMEKFHPKNALLFVDADDASDAEAPKADAPVSVGTRFELEPIGMKFQLEPVELGEQPSPDKAEAPTIEAPTIEAVKTEAPAIELSTVEESKTEVPAVEEAMTEEAMTETAKVEAPSVEEAKTEAPADDEAEEEYAPIAKTESPEYEEKTEAPSIDDAEALADGKTAEYASNDAPSVSNEVMDEAASDTADTTQEPAEIIPPLFYGEYDGGSDQEIDSIFSELTGDAPEGMPVDDRDELELMMDELTDSEPIAELKPSSMYDIPVKVPEKVLRSAFIDGEAARVTGAFGTSFVHQSESELDARLDDAISKNNAAGSAPYAYDVEVLIADDVPPDEADRIVKGYEHRSGRGGSPIDSWNIPEPELEPEAEPENELLSGDALDDDGYESDHAEEPLPGSTSYTGSIPAEIKKNDEYLSSEADAIASELDDDSEYQSGEEVPIAPMENAPVSDAEEPAPNIEPEPEIEVAAEPEAAAEPEETAADAKPAPVEEDPSVREIREKILRSQMELDSKLELLNRRLDELTRQSVPQPAQTAAPVDTAAPESGDDEPVIELPPVGGYDDDDDEYTYSAYPEDMYESDSDDQSEGSHAGELDDDFEDQSGYSYDDGYTEEESAPAAASEEYYAEPEYSEAPDEENAPFEEPSEYYEENGSAGYAESAYTEAPASEVVYAPEQAEYQEYTDETYADEAYTDEAYSDGSYFGGATYAADGSYPYDGATYADDTAPATETAAPFEETPELASAVAYMEEMGDLSDADDEEALTPEERIEREIREQERRIEESRQSRRSLELLAMELDRTIAQDTASIAEAARQKVDAERKRREPKSDPDDYSYGEPEGTVLHHRVQGKKPPRHSRRKKK